MSTDRIRLDDLLVRRGLVRTKSRARDAILRGCVTVDGKRIAKAGAPVGESAHIHVDDPASGWVSRGALKLIAGLDAFGFDVAGQICIDIGASTGGFTEVLLHRGAARVYAIEVGHGQMVPSLALDPRVKLVEGLNARDLTVEHVPDPVGAVVADVSFIPLRLVLEPALRLATMDAILVALIKPQFEVGRGALGKGGIVRDADAAQRSADDVANWLGVRGWRTAGLIDSPIDGGDGNREFLIGARYG
jgi:23S rRNA (cytidine1920-2'-O)/16S rRNA (cytidine1409-2'-O)-methyltransferase